MSDMTPEQAREHNLARIRDYAVTHGLSGEDIVLLFEAGLFAASRLRPAIFGPPPFSGAEAD